MHSKKRVASVKQISKNSKGTAKLEKEFYLNSTENSLTRLRQNSYKNGAILFEDINEHIKRCKETCNSVSKRLNSKDKDKLVMKSGIKKKYYVGGARGQNKPKRADMNKKKTKYSHMRMIYQNAVYKSLNLNFSPSNSSACSASNSRDVSLKSKDSADGSKNFSGLARLIDKSTADMKALSQNPNLS